MVKVVPNTRVWLDGWMDGGRSEPCLTGVSEPLDLNTYPRTMWQPGGSYYEANTWLVPGHFPVKISGARLRMASGPSEMVGRCQAFGDGGVATRRFECSRAFLVLQLADGNSGAPARLQTAIKGSSQARSAYKTCSFLPACMSFSLVFPLIFACISCSFAASCFAVFQPQLLSIFEHVSCISVVDPMGRALGDSNRTGQWRPSC